MPATADRTRPRQQVRRDAIVKRCGVYIRVSTDTQTTNNQRFEILKFADEKKLIIGSWTEENISSTKPHAYHSIRIGL